MTGFQQWHWQVPFGAFRFFHAPDSVPQILGTGQNTKNFQLFSGVTSQGTDALSGCLWQNKRLTDFEIYPENISRADTLNYYCPEAEQKKKDFLRTASEKTIQYQKPRKTAVPQGSFENDIYITAFYIGFPNARQRNVFLFLPGWYWMNFKCLSGCRFPDASRNLTGCTFILPQPALAGSRKFRISYCPEKESKSRFPIHLIPAEQTSRCHAAAHRRKTDADRNVNSSSTSQAEKLFPFSVTPENS